MQDLHDDTAGSRWKGLYRTGGVAALILVVITLLQFIAFMVSPPPYEGGAIEWFTLFHESWLNGLLAFELLMVIYVLVSIPLSLALYFSLRQASPSIMILYLAFSLVGVVCFIAARPAFEMLSLSERYAAAATDAQRSILLAAGEAKLAAFDGTAFQVSYYLGSLGGVLVAIGMLKNKLFSKATAILRLLSSAFDFGLLIPVVGLYISIFSVLFLLIWDILVARRLFQLGRSAPNTLSNL